MYRVICVVMAVISSGGYGAAVAASVQLDFDVSDIGTGLPYELASFSILNYQSTGVGVSKTANVSDLVITRKQDASSPKLLEAAVKGKVFKKVEIHGTATYGDAGEQTYLKVELENVQITSYQLGVIDQEPAEIMALYYVKATADSVPAPNPPQTAWGLLLPNGLPPGGMEPYQFPIVLDAPTVEVLFSRPPSPLGDGLRPTLFHVVGVPEPATPTLALIGLLLLGRRRVGARRGARSAK